MQLKKIQVPSLESRHKTVSQYYRNDRLHIGKNIVGNPLWCLIRTIAIYQLDFINKLSILENEMDIAKANTILDFWEKFVGLPDDCLPIAESTELRRRNILLKFTWLQNTLYDKITYILSLFNITQYEIFYLNDYYVYGSINALYGQAFYADPLAINFTIYIKIPYIYKGVVYGTGIYGTDIYGSDITDTIKCLVSKILPETHDVKIIFYDDEPIISLITDDNEQYLQLDDDFYLDIT